MKVQSVHTKPVKSIPSYNSEGKTKALFFSVHKKDGMVNAISKTCTHEECKQKNITITSMRQKPILFSA